ncbi:MAG: NifU family protein [Longimicrobiales bacterium]
MLTFTEAARDVIVSLASQMDGAALRIVCTGGSPLAPEYELSLVDEKEASDIAINQGDFKVYVAGDSLQLVQGRTIDYLQTVEGAGFVIRQPDSVRQDGARPTGPLAERVLRVLEEQINPGVAQHGGQITLVEVKDDVAYLEMSGGCQGCGMARVTLRQGVERMLKQAVPELQGVVDVTDHAGGENPYYN